MNLYTETLPGGAKLLQSDAHLKIGTDAVLLAEHAGPGRVICDLGCGCGAVLLRLCELRPQAELVGLELQPEAAALCRESIALSGFAGRASAVTGDLRDRTALRSLGPGRFDLVVCNPPYLSRGTPPVKAILLRRASIWLRIPLLRADTWTPKVRQRRFRHLRGF